MLPVTRMIGACLSGQRCHLESWADIQGGRHSLCSCDWRVLYARGPTSWWFCQGNCATKTRGTDMPVAMRHEHGNIYGLEIRGTLRRTDFEQCERMLAPE